jgi:hypothetical protein
MFCDCLFLAGVQEDIVDLDLPRRNSVEMAVKAIVNNHPLRALTIPTSKTSSSATGNRGPCSDEVVRRAV